MKEILIAMLLTALLMVPQANALMQVAGALQYNVTAGGSGVARYGLVNDENQTVTLKLNATGDAVKYISYPSSVEINPGQLTYVNVTAKIPSDYNFSKGTNVTGYIYALEEGKSGGQVQINIQMKKGVRISVLPPAGNNLSFSALMTGFVSMVSGNLPLTVVLALLICVAIVLARTRNKIKIKKKTRTNPKRKVRKKKR